MSQLVLFERRWEITLGSRKFTDIDCTFSIEKTTGRAPNTLALSVFNLRQESRTISPAHVQVKAGFASGVSTLFLGEIQRVTHTRSETTLSTDIEASDKGTQLAQARVNQSFARGTSLETVVRACVDALGIGVGNIHELERAEELAGMGRAFPDGTVLSGNAARELTQVLRSIGLRWSVQDGALQLQRRGQSLRTQAVLLNANTGLLGAPSLDEKGHAVFRSFILPGIVPGARVKIESEFVRGVFGVDRCKYSGDTRGGEWAIECEGKPE